MDIQELKNLVTFSVQNDAGNHERRKLAFEFGDLVHTLDDWSKDAERPLRVRQRAQDFLTAVCIKADEFGGQLLVPGYLLNAVGEIMARQRYIAEPLENFIRTGLYFYGLDYIEKNFRSKAVHFLTAHAELVAEFMGRESLLEVIDAANKRFAEGRPFCLVHHYVNALKKMYWAHLRASNDLCDHSGSLPVLEAESSEALLVHPADAMEPSANDRIQLMLKIFAEQLDDTQRRIYLWRHGLPGSGSETLKASPFDDLEQLANGLESEGADKERWTDVAEKLGVTEKTAKREYLRALLTLLRESARVVFGDLIPSNYVRRVLDTLRTVTQERDLRLKDTSGHGLGPLVERWEIALRFVLNHQGVKTTVGPSEWWKEDAK